MAKIKITGHESDSIDNRVEPTEFNIAFDMTCKPENVLILENELVRRIQKDVVDKMNSERD